MTNVSDLMEILSRCADDVARYEQIEEALAQFNGDVGPKLLAAVAADDYEVIRAEFADYLTYSDAQISIFDLEGWIAMEKSALVSNRLWLVAAKLYPELKRVELEKRRTDSKGVDRIYIIAALILADKKIDDFLEFLKFVFSKNRDESVIASSLLYLLTVKEDEQLLKWVVSQKDALHPEARNTLAKVFDFELE